MKTSYLSLVSGVMIAGMAGSALAAPISLPGDTPLTIDFFNREQISVTGSIVAPSGASEANWGIFSVNTIRTADITSPNSTIEADTTSTQLFSGSASEQITGIFYGLGLEDFDSDTGTLQANGGFIDLYWDETGLASGGTIASLSGASPGDRIADDQFTGFTDGIFLTRLAFASGIDPTNPDVTVSGSSAGFPNNVTGTSSAEGYLNQVVGATNYDGDVGFWDGQFDRDWFQNDPDGNPLAFGSRDLRFRNTFSNNDNWDGDGDIIGANSSDPVDVVTVPEPGMLGLIGLGLVAAGFSVRRSRPESGA